jgi:hypothetical protein
MLPIFWFVVLLWFVFVFGYQVLLQVVNDKQWKSIILGYCKYNFPFLSFSLFCDG